MPPAQPLESGEIAVGRHELAAVLDGQGGQIGVGHERSLNRAAKDDEGDDEGGAGAKSDQAGSPDASLTGRTFAGASRAMSGHRGSPDNDQLGIEFVPHSL